MAVIPMAPSVASDAQQQTTDSGYGGILPLELRNERDRLINGFADVIDAEGGKSAAPMMAALVTLVGRWFADVASYPGNDLKLESLREMFAADMRTVAAAEYPTVWVARVCASAPALKDTPRRKPDPESG
jgi:hypothetical protein